MKMNEQLLAGMHEALALLQQGGGPGAATIKIQQTLQGLMPSGIWTGAASAPRAAAAAPAPSGATAFGVVPGGFVPDLLARFGIDAPTAVGLERPSFVPLGETQTDGRVLAPGQFLSGSFTNEAGTRAYKLYVPTAYQSQPLPLVVLLHGCAQTPDDLAAGTRWNTIAEEEPCLVLYPVQAASVSITRCWNWFNPVDQQRDQGEPSIIAGMTREIIATWHVDPTRVYIAGLSAGGAMAAVMAATYPEIYAALGIHSGMPYAAASDFSSALEAMQGAAEPVVTASLQGMPTIVFHGDRDQTVNPRNGDHIMAQTIPPQARSHTKKVQAGAGHGYTQTVHEGADGAVLAEQWVVHGAGHAWSGGSRRGSFTDGKGPDASREMMRFFAARAQPKGDAVR